MAAGDPGSGGARAGDAHSGRVPGGDAHRGGDGADQGDSCAAGGGADRDDHDFDALYRALGFDGGGLDALKACYRRRVAQWHPDREGATPAQAERLKLLNRRYAAAVAFHRRWGRLPGENMPRASPRIDRHAAAPPPSPCVPQVPVRRHAWLAAGAVVVLACVAGWQWSGTTDVGTAAESSNGEPAPAAATPGARGGERRVRAAPAGRADAALLERGLTRDAVLALLGPPAIRHDGDALWSYGPSWIVFECGRVAGWYSSPLAGLRARGARPGERVGLGPGEASKACTPELPALAGEAAR